MELDQCFIDEIELALSDPPYNGKNITNHVLIEEKDYKDQPLINIRNRKINYFIPAYIWIKLKNFTNLDQVNLEACINVIVIITINMKQMPQILKSYINSQLTLRFNKDEAVKLGDEGVMQITKKQIETDIQQITVRKILKTGMQSQIRYAPFQIIYLILSVSLQQIQFNRDIIEHLLKQNSEKLADMSSYEDDVDEQQIKVLAREIQQISLCKNIRAKFNLMDISNKKFTRIEYTDEGTFGNYDLAEKKLDVQYTNADIPSYSRITGKAQETVLQEVKGKNYAEIEEYSYAHFIIPLYKYPAVGIVTIFVPLFLLSVLNLGVFFQDTGLSDRLNTMAALLIAFVAFIPIIREQLPPSPNFSLVQILVYIQAISTLFCFFESLQVRGNEKYEFSWTNNPLFLISMAIPICQFITISFFYCRYRYHYNRNYNRNSSQQIKSHFKYRSHWDWCNPECDKHFRRKIDSRQIQVLKIKKKEQEIIIKRN